MRIFHNLNVNWLGHRKFFYFLSLTIFLAGLASVTIRGFKFGLDFRGGSEIVLDFKHAIDIHTVRGQLSNINLGGIEVKTFGNSTGVLIRTELQEIPDAVFPKITTFADSTISEALASLATSKAVKDSLTEKKSEVSGKQGFKKLEQTKNTLTYRFVSADSAKVVVDKLFAAGFQASRLSEEPTSSDVVIHVGIADWIKYNLRQQYLNNPFTVLREDRIGPKVGGEMKRDALISVVLALLMILIYLAFRFKVIFAAGAVIALFHDVLITVGLFSLLYGVIPGLNLEIDLTVLAAFLTLIGYSINDTVIVFDRVRENIHLNKTGEIQEVMNKSINQTMSRTILTAGTVLLTSIILLIFGGEVLRAFSATFLFGIITGTYSSIFVASALVLDYVKKTGKKIEF